LFRYPGIRSDSDMHTLGYNFRPWRDGLAIADGHKIRAYIETRHARPASIATSASAAGRAGRLVLGASPLDRAHRHRRRLLPLPVMCAGYYSYEEGHRPQWEGEADFAGAIVHPQFWPEDLDWHGKRVAVIGSGATA
jgi:cation diffusion facilitator CzcD-associated flavoprotein CzcO